jgi:ArsR family transcriptional regulator, arsenate/arsenite/antimonite-responsive transcriptional repressor
MTGTKFLRLLADETRLRILSLLVRTPDLCVCELVAVLRLPQYQISRQLGPLRRTGLLTATRRGPFVFYGIAQDARAHPVYRTLLRTVPQLVDGTVGGDDVGRMKRLMKLETDARASACEAMPAATTTIRRRPLLRVLKRRQAV